MGAAAAFLVACGSSDEGGGTGGTGTGGTSGSSLLTPPSDTSGSAQTGGVWPNTIANETPTLDVFATTVGSAQAPWSYSRFMMYTPALRPDLPDGSVEPDGIEDYELEPDGLRITLNLRQDLILDSRAPTNGRAMDAEDIRFSVEKFKATGLSRGEFFNELQSSSAIDQFEMLDDHTVAFTLAFPKASLLSDLAFQRYMWFMPREADGGFDPRNEMRGTGPWKLMRWEPSVGYFYERNENWHHEGPYLDGMEMRILSEYSQIRAQLLAGNLWNTPFSPQQTPAEDILNIKREQPRLNLYAGPFPDSRPTFISFGLLPDSPFHDERVRRAMSMLIDRETFLQTFFNISDFESAGLPVEYRWHTHFAAGEPPYWLDPQPENSELGEGAAYFQYNPEEAAAMMRAAGHSSPLQLTGNFGATASGAVQQQIQVLSEMISAEGLFSITLASRERAEWENNYFNGQGQYEGLAMNNGPGVSGDIDNHLTVRFNVGAAPQLFFNEVFPWYERSQQLIEEQRRELDRDRRLSLLSDLQKELAVQMPAVPWPGQANGFELAWPFMENFATFTPKSTLTHQTETWPRYWYNPEKED